MCRGDPTSDWRWSWWGARYRTFRPSEAGDARLAPSGCRDTDDRCRWFDITSRCRGSSAGGHQVSRRGDGADRSPRRMVRRLFSRSVFSRFVAVRSLSSVVVLERSGEMRSPIGEAERLDAIVVRHRPGCGRIAIGSRGDDDPQTAEVPEVRPYSRHRRRARTLPIATPCATVTGVPSGSGMTTTSTYPASRRHARVPDRSGGRGGETDQDRRSQDQPGPEHGPHHPSSSRLARLARSFLMPLSGNATVTSSSSRVSLQETTVPSPNRACRTRSPSR